jgi:membrane-associated protein
VAAILGDQCNYSIGRYFGPKVFQWENSRFLQQARLRPGACVLREIRRRHHHGGAFLPFVRTFAPFVAGVADMTRSKFTCSTWSGGPDLGVGIVTARLLFRQHPVVKANLDKVIWAMIFVPGLFVLGP